MIPTENAMVEEYMDYYECSTPMELICEVIQRLGETETLEDIWEDLNVRNVEDIKDGNLYDYLLEFGGEPQAQFWRDLIYFNLDLIDEVMDEVM